MQRAHEYKILDSGEGRKLEQVGTALLDRQATTAAWRAQLPRTQWEKVDAVHVRSERGGGHWDVRRPLPEPWAIRYAGIELILQATPFGHLGFFAEHAAQWDWMRAELQAAADPGDAPRVLNLFAYTGAASLACAAAGARVTHVDAAGPIVEWARRNAAANEVPKDRLRWIVEDASAFVRREARRGEQYDAIVLDPPSYGRIGRKQVWRIEESLIELLDCARPLLAERCRFVLLTCHTPGFTGIALENLLRDALAPRAGRCESGEMWVEQEDGRRLPSGFYARWQPGE